MDIINKELQKRYDEIKADIEATFKANFDITGWDIPEVDENEVSKKLLKLMQKALDEVKEEVLGSSK